MDAQKLKAIAWTPEAVAAFQSSCDASPFGPLLSPLELLHESYLHEYVKGNQAALVAIKRLVTSGGCRVHVQGLVNQDPRNPISVRCLLSEIEASAVSYGADVMSMITQHKGLVTASVRLGGTITGAVVTKHLRRH